ncbi:hypothetical protein GCM10010532_023680 [Dactylosporangium siamense]|uniref:Uncharacterized protein n=1 Tax=Dactylosporangium siamense TaxID=685454 RepID=A0A919PG57_9ACTN|nr:hypothetical protein Dsi01nite_016080 [Dactylosporangium siamense]
MAGPPPRHHRSRLTPRPGTAEHVTDGGQKYEYQLRRSDGQPIAGVLTGHGDIYDPGDQVARTSAF